MHNIPQNTCGKFVQSMGIPGGDSCDGLSTLTYIDQTNTQQTRGKAPVLLVFMDCLSTLFSTVYFARINLLSGGLSPLSTVPITTTTNERIER